jgi:two-component system chemotaxis response regulator CheB
MEDIPLQDHLADSQPHNYEVIAIASSAGGIHALMGLLSELPVDFAVPILIVQHLDPNYPSMLPEILNRHSRLKVVRGEEGMLIQSGFAYVAPPDQHMLINPDHRISLTRTELVHFVRPSADLLFDSMAAAYKGCCIAVVLTGTGQDGSMGVQAVKKMGGTIIAQSKDSSEYFGMPGAAIKTGMVDYILPLKMISQILISLIKTGEAPDAEGKS